MFLKISFLFGLESHFFLFFYKKIFNFLNFKCFKNIYNNRVSYLDIGFSGILPLFNLFFLKKIIFFGYYLKNYLFYISLFVRKNYFYPDMPKNYQISQYSSIFNYGLLLIYNNYNDFPYYKFINIIKIHFEEDSAKISYDLKQCFSKLDFNRSNNFLLEIVSYYNLSNFYEIYIYIKNIKYFIFFLKKKIIKNFLRFDLNISSKYLFYEFLIFKIEIKNLDSFFILKNIINFELKRQIFNLFFLKFYNETRFYNLKNDFTYFIRIKDNFYNYKYFYEPEKNYLFFSKKFYFLFKFKIILFYYLKIYYLYNFKYYFQFNFYIFELFFFIFKFKKNKILNFLKNLKFYLNKKNKFSIFQIFILLKCFLNNIISYFNFKKIFFFIIKKNIKNLLFIYKVILKNNLILNLNTFFILNFILINNIKFIHNYFFNKKIFNFFLGFLINFNYISDKFFNLINYKIFFSREVGERFKPHI